MFLLYLDDSGSVQNQHEEYLVLGGVCVAEHQVNALTHALDELAGRFDATDPDSVEFHASAIYSGKEAPWNNLKKPEERREVLKEVLRVFKDADLPACALGCAVHKKSFPGQDPMEIAFAELCTWFDDFLRNRHQGGAPDEKGIIFLDESTYETSLRQIARDFRRKGLTSENGRYIIDGPHFVKSKTTRCVQLADHVAYAAFRYFHAKDNNYLSVVLNRFQSDGRTFQGLRHMEANISECTCPGCLTMRACAGTLTKV
ncbi:DUF3800 domain-containing protein [Tundrisphaera lichenicola]|uniref:DUF3800 domain-containing protein n=1 Tax=Tundrisphaera lichenicola TaxID=2029860 RepID=UPI003EB95CCF